MNEAAERANRITEQALALGALQKPEEFSQLVRWVDAMAPKVIVEIGCDCGGTLAAWKFIAPTVIGVTLPDNRQPFSTGRPLQVPDGATMIYGDSKDPKTFLRLSEALDGRTVDFLFIDADHTFEGCWRDWDNYRSLARWVGFHDIFSDPAQPNMGVDKVWSEIKSEGIWEPREFTSLPHTWGGIGVCRGACP